MKAPVTTKDTDDLLKDVGLYAIEFIEQKDNGRHKDLHRHEEALRNAIDRYKREHDYE